MANLNPNRPTVAEALAAVRDEVMSTSNEKDIQYFDYHQKRFERLANSLCTVLEPGTKILDIGSHYLHVSMLLTKLGFELYAVDVEEFWEIDFIQKRINQFGIAGIAENDLESFESIAQMKDQYDAVLFTEVMEHITFNPVNFWNRVHSSLRSGGVIYITTPNSLALPNLLRTIKNLITFRGIGIEIKDVFSKVTYGHHWKEYSPSEIRRYFRMLSDDFRVKIKFFNYHTRQDPGFKFLIWHALMKVGTWFYFLAPDMEVIVKIQKSGEGFKIAGPAYH